MLEAEIVHSMNEYLRCHGICYANEIRMGIGIPDISFNLGGNRKIKYIDDYYLLTVWDYINTQKGTTLKEIGERFSFSMEKVKRYVFELVKINLVTVRDEVVKAVNSVKNARLGVTVAVEAKIRDWKNGLIQAQRYLFFSDYSYLALPKKNIRLVDKDALAEAGIGLLAIDNQCLEEIIAAQKSNECTYYMKYMHTSVLFDQYKKNNDRYIRKKDHIFTHLVFED